MSGASANAARVNNSASLEEAVGHAIRWFQGKKSLFLIDDLWPTEECPTGYLLAFRQLLRESPESRMAISTRSVSIAVRAGSIVEFGARDPLGPVSSAIFMAHARECSRNGGDDISPSMAKILSRCGGLPIALSVSGCAVALLVRRFGDFERACDFYVTDLEEGRLGLGTERDPGGKSLSECILLSLKYLQIEFLKWKVIESSGHRVTL